MPRRGRREGAGRPVEYHEPIEKFLIGLPSSAMQRLDRYAKDHQLSRPKAIMRMLDEVEQKKPERPKQAIPIKKQQLKAKKRQQLLEELKALKASRSHG